MSKQYISIFAYKLKQESIDLITNRFPEVLILSDEMLCDATYIFVPEELYSSKSYEISSSFLGAFNEVTKTPISESEVDKMFKKLNKEKNSIILTEGVFGYLEGFGSVQMCISKVDGDELTLIPTSINLFKPIICNKSLFKVEKEPSEYIEYTYNLSIAIDCDMFPNTNQLEDCTYYSVMKSVLAQIMFNVHSILDNVVLYLINPCPLIMLAGASLGLRTTKDTTIPLLSDTKDSHIKVNPKKNFTILNVSELSRGVTVVDKINVSSLIKFYEELHNTTSLNSYEIYQLLNRKFFYYRSILDITLRDNPLIEGE